MGQLRDRSLHFTSEGIALIEEAMQGKDWDKSQLAEQVEISYESICRYLRGERPPQRKNIEIIAKRLGLKPIDLVNPDEWISSTKVSETKTSLVDWRSVSKGMLDNLKRLTTEALTAGDGIRFDFDDVFVPLGVVERQQKTKRNEDDGAPDRGSELYEEKVTPITHGEFFEDVLLRGNTKISKGKRIAVIGEAGAGKTTQLQKIGSWLLDESDDIPVWISLTDLGAKSLREYLFENWVREASGEIEAAPQVWKDSLGDAIKSGKVWLLLDGVDEMTVSNPLSYLSNQLNESWLKNVRVVLTCRVNVWDGGKNALTGFDVYRNLDFDYPDDVYKFIGKWFARTPDLAGSLTQALEQSGKERIRDMVKNPLRLTLLCYSWQLKQGELPETKAGLYEWFVEAFYKWNKGKAQIELSRSQEDTLNRALGELAKRAIDGENSRFRLTKTFIENVFREFDIDLFDIALKLNWLNEIGVAAEDSLETVYAFYHPSFQEYFAALAINNWDYFLPREHTDKPIKDERGNFRKYRVFETIWREVITLWIGKTDISDKDKIDFINIIAKFEDGCGNLYFCHAYILAASLLFEVSHIESLGDLINQIIDRIVFWSFGDYDLQNSTWYSFPKLFEKTFNTIIFQIDKTKSINSILFHLDKIRPLLIEYYNVSLDWFPEEVPNQILNIARKLGGYAGDNTFLFELSIKRIEDEEYSYDHYIFSECIRNSIMQTQTVKKLLQILSAKRETRKFNRDNDLSNIVDSIISCLGRSKVCREEIIDELIKIINNPEDKMFHLIASENLLKIDPNNSTAIFIVFSIGFNRIKSDILDQTNSNNQIDLPTIFDEKTTISQLLFKLIDIPLTNDFKRSNFFKSEISFIYRLKEIASDNPIAIDLLMQIILITEIDSPSSNLAINCLKNIASINIRVIIIFIKILEIITGFNIIEVNRSITSLEIIDKICFYFSNIIEHGFYDIDVLQRLTNILTFILGNEAYKEHHLSVINCLGAISPSNSIVKDKMIDIIKNVGYQHSMEGINIGSIFYKELKLITELQSQILKAQSEDAKNGFARLLAQIDSDNYFAIHQLTYSLKNSQYDMSQFFLGNDNEEIEGFYGNYISLINTLSNHENMKFVVSNLNNPINSFLNRENKFNELTNCFEVLWHCSLSLSYPDFYEAWHSQPTSTHPEIADTIPSNNTNKIQIFESQLIDCEAIQKELDRTTDHPEIRCLVVDIRQLEQESDPNVIAKKLTNKIFKSIGRRIPVVQDVSCLERELLNLKLEPSFEKLAIALYGKSANEAINQLCQNLAPIQIRPFTGGQTTQELISQINAWRSEM